MKIGKHRITLNVPDAFVLIVMTAYACYLFFQCRTFKNAEVNLTLIRPVFYVFIAFLVIHLARSVKIVRVADETGEGAEKAPFKTRLQAFWAESGRIVVIMAAAIVYALAVKYLGFFVATLVVLPLTMYLLGVRRLWLLAVITVATVAFFYVCFDLWLGVTLPAGALFTRLGLGI